MYGSMTKKLLFLSAVMVFSFSAAFASWDDISPTPAISYPLNGVSFIDIATGYAAGGGGTVIKTQNAGLSFEAISGAGLWGTTNLNDVVFPSSTEGYLLGDAGEIYVTTDEGTTYTKMSVPTELTSADFRKGSFYGNNRTFAVYNQTISTSYLYSSTDGGLNFSTAEVPGYEILGVTLTEDATWEWVSSSSGYSILKNGALKWGPNAQKVNDLFFVDNDIGFAVGSGGLILRTTNGSDFSNLTSGTLQNLNAAYFIASSVGWVVGDNGTILYTLDGGDHFTAYEDTSLDSTGLRDIAIKTTGSGGKVVAHAYVVGEGGKVFKLASPSITSVAPNSRMQGWVGNVTIEGTGFVPGAAVQFGSTEVVTFSTTVESMGTKINSVIVIQPQAIVGSRDVTVTNPDITYTNEAGSFFITANPLVVSLSNARFDGDIIQSGSYTISPNTNISFEVYSSAADLTKATLNPKILFFQDGYYKAIYNIPGDAITLKATNEANVNFTIPAALPLTSGTAEVELYAEDSLGNVGRGLPVTLEVGSSFAEAGAGTDTATGLLVGNPISGAIIQVRFKKGVAPPDEVTVYVFVGTGGDVAFKKTFKLSGLKASAPDVNGGYHFNFPFSVEDLAPQYRRACLALGVVTARGNIIGKFKFPIWMNGAF